MQVCECDLAAVDRSSSAHETGNGGCEINKAGGDFESRFGHKRRALCDILNMYLCASVCFVSARNWRKRPQTRWPASSYPSLPNRSSLRPCSHSPQHLHQKNTSPTVTSKQQLGFTTVFVRLTVFPCEATQNVIHLKWYYNKKTTPCHVGSLVRQASCDKARGSRCKHVLLVISRHVVAWKMDGLESRLPLSLKWALKRESAKERDVETDRARGG